MQQLFPFQATGAAFLAERARALLCDEPGLGKTAQAIRAADLAGAERVLVLCPAAVVENWRREFLLWQTRPRQILLPRKPADLAAPHEVAILSYDMARSKPMTNRLLSCSWDVMIADEAHYLKNRQAARTGAARALAAVASRAWGLTGTPMPNTADELWPLLAMFGPVALGDPPLPYWAFRKRYCVDVPMGRFGSKIVGVRNTEELKARMAPILLRRKKREVLKDLPLRREDELPLSAGKDSLAELRTDTASDPELAWLINRVLAAVLLSDDVDNDVQHILEGASADSMSRLRRITGSIKARVLAPLLAEEMAGHGDKIVIGGWHREVLDVLQTALAPFGVVRLDGQTAPAQRQAAVDAFQTDPAVRVFLGQIQSAGTGITLTAAADLVFAEMSWTPSDNAQFAMRVDRIGQTRGGLTRYATLAGTIDEAVIRTLRRKTQDIRTVLEGVAV